MKNKEFEKLMVDKIIESIISEPNLWDTSIMGLRRSSDKLELRLESFGKEISIYRPKVYKFIDKDEMKRLYLAADGLQNRIRANKEAKDEHNNVQEISKLLGLNTRKNKLEHLGTLTEKDDTQNKITTKKSSSFWKRFKI